MAAAQIATDDQLRTEHAALARPEGLREVKGLRKA